VDNSEFTRNGDYAPTRFQAQADAVNLLAGAKTQHHPENTVGVMTMAGKTPQASRGWAEPRVPAAAGWRMVVSDVQHLAWWCAVPVGRMVVCWHASCWCLPAAAVYTPVAQVAAAPAVIAHQL